MRTDLVTQAKAIKAAADELEAKYADTKAQLEEKIRELLDAEAARDKLQAFIDVTDWGTLDTGAEIKAGDIVRYGALKYSARVDHTKALTRSPINLVYWSIITDDEEASESDE